MIWPNQNTAALNAFYGNPVGQNGLVNPHWKAVSLVGVPVPYHMVVAWALTVPVKQIFFHHKCAGPLARVLSGILALYKTQAEIEKHGMHLYSGAYSYRAIRGSSHLSMHAYGCAIDLDSEHNPLGSRHGTMSKEVVKLFQDEGAEWGGRWHSRPDPMHFQWAKT
jgi:hypothetical protein